MRTYTRNKFYLLEAWSSMRGTVVLHIKAKGEGAAVLIAARFLGAKRVMQFALHGHTYYALPLADAVGPGHNIWGQPQLAIDWFISCYQKEWVGEDWYVVEACDEIKFLE